MATTINDRVKDVYYGKTLRKSFARSEEILEMPYLLEIQKKSYRWFFETGLQEVFNDVEAITDYAGNLELSFIGWYLLSGLTCGILAVLYVLPYHAFAHTAFYRDLVPAQPVSKLWCDAAPAPQPAPQSSAAWQQSAPQQQAPQQDVGFAPLAPAPQAQEPQTPDQAPQPDQPQQPDQSSDQAPQI